MKKIIVLVVFLITIICFMPVLNAESSVILNDEVRLYIDGEQCEYNDRLVILNESFLSPMESFLADLGVPNDNKHVIWSSDKKSVSIIKDKININLTIGSRKAKVNRREILLNASPVIYRSKVYVPVRFIAESLGKRVAWDKSTNSIFIYNYDTYNKAKEYLSKAGSIFSASNKYKVTAKITTNSGDCTELINYNLEVDKNRLLAHGNVSEKLSNGRVLTSEIYVNNNLEFNKIDDGEWDYTRHSSDYFNSQMNKLYSMLNLSDIYYTGFNINESPDNYDIVMKSDSFLNALLKGSDYGASKIEISCDKKTNLLKKIKLCISETGESLVVEIQFSFDTGFEITIPDGIANLPQKEMSVEDKLQTAMTLVMEDNYEEAIGYYEEVIAIDPNNYEAYEGKIRALVELDKFDQALIACDKLLSFNPDNTIVLMKKGECLKSLYRYDEAIQCYNKVIELAPYNINSYMRKADVLVLLGKDKEAEECRKTAIDKLKQYDNNEE